MEEFLAANPSSDVRRSRIRLQDLAKGLEHGITRVVPCDQVLAFFGLSPKLGPIAEWGLALERKQVVVDTEKFETSVPGIFAVGDVNTYPGKKKLILSGFHEAALAAFAAKEHLEPGRKVPLQYTTTSPAMHRRLGVSPDVEDAAAGQQLRGTTSVSFTYDAPDQP